MKKTGLLIGLAAAAIVVAAAVIFWFFLNREDLDSTKESMLLSWGRLAGILAALAFLFQLLSMGKGRTMEHCFRKPPVIRLHKVFGYCALVLIAVHVPLIFAGRSISFDESFSDSLRSFAFDRGWGSLACFGAVLFLAVIVFCAAFQRKFIKFPFWKKTHLFVYAALAALFFHQIFFGRDFTASKWFLAFWIAMFALAFLDAAVWKIRAFLNRGK